MNSEYVYLAIVGYEAFNNTIKDYLGLYLPAWNNLPDKIQEGWVNAAKAIIDFWGGEDEEIEE